MRLEEIRQLWQEHAARRFPRLHGQSDVDDVCLISTDSAIAGCIDTFCRRTSNGRLDPEREAILRRSVENIERVIDRMPSHDVTEYFRRLLGLAHAVLELHDLETRAD